MNHVPEYKQKQVLIGNDSGAESQRYYAFPSILESGDGNIIIAYKNGTQHALEAGAPLEVLTFDPVQKEVVSVYTVDETPGRINQNPELLRMPDGTVYMYVDVQRGGTKERLGLHVYRSTDEGASFQNDPVFPQVGDFVFGYSFDDAVTSDGAAVMLAMSFPELPGAVRAVHAIRSEDSGRSWEYVRNLSEEFRFAFNESSLCPLDGGYIVIARGDDKATRAYRTDERFRLMAERHLSDEDDRIDYIGRPKLFERSGTYYILCRNVPAGQNKGTLQLYELDPRTLKLKGNVLLDVDEGASLGDSYYAEPYFLEENGRIWFNVITYVPKLPGDLPDIVRLEYDWVELSRVLADSLRKVSLQQLNNTADEEESLEGGLR